MNAHERRWAFVGFVCGFAVGVVATVWGILLLTAGSHY